MWFKLVGVVYFLVLVGIMALVNAKEPLFFQIIIRYRAYQDFYPNNALHPGQASQFKNF